MLRAGGGAWYYADVDLNGELAASTPLSFQARMRIDGFDSSFRGAAPLMLGFFGPSTMHYDSSCDYIGIAFNDGEISYSARLGHDSGARTTHGSGKAVPIGQAFEVSFTWDPGANISDRAVSILIDGTPLFTNAQGQTYWASISGLDSFGFYRPQERGLPGSGSATFYLDDVRYMVAPEPATLSLLALGGVLLIRKRRSRKPQLKITYAPEATIVFEARATLGGKPFSFPSERLAV